MVCGGKEMKLGFRIWLLIFILLASIASIFVSSGDINAFKEGVLITSVEQNSTAFEQGLRKGMVIISIDNQQVKNVQDFTNLMQSKYISGQNIKTIIQTEEFEAILFTDHAPEITVSEIPTTDLKLGLDLAGGARALVRAENVSLTKQQVNELVDVTQNRLNEFGLTDMQIMPVSDLSGNNFMLIEIAGATPNDLEDLISKQGVFEAKIGNQTIFEGGARDIVSVARSGTQSGITSCKQQSADNHFCNFRFAIYLSEEAAKKHAEVTSTLAINYTAQGDYLEKPLDLYLDEKKVDSLRISSGLKGMETTQISISGSGSGPTQADAYDNAEKEMSKLQALLITGSLPYKLEIVKLDTISPLIGKEFIKTILIAGLVTLLAVAILIFVRYRNIKSSLALVLTSFSEVIIILGIASFIEWNLDLPSIAGILATIGTGIDQQIIILDEASKEKEMNIKQRLKRAFAVIIGAYFTAVVALLPLLWAGAGLLKGFAITTIIGITAGILITRPAFTEIIKKIQD